MCSISGFISQYPLDRETSKRLSSALLFFGSIRGNQSSGIYTNGKIVKKAIEPAKFIVKNDFLDQFKKKPDIVLCHTRMPTCGGTGDEQAQPFLQNETITVHNGYYHNIEELKAKWNIVKNSGVDSELVTSFIDSYGIKELPKFLESTSGVSAIACLHKNQLYIATHGNPVNYTRLSVGGNHVLIFASTSDILEKALNHVWLGKWNIEKVKDNTFFMVTPKRLKELSKIKGKSYIEWDYDWKHDLTDSFDYMTGYSNKKGTKRERLKRIAGYEYQGMIDSMSDNDIEKALDDNGDYE